MEAPASHGLCSAPRPNTPCAAFNYSALKNAGFSQPCFLRASAPPWQNSLFQSAKIRAIRGSPRGVLLMILRVTMRRVHAKSLG